ncbi:AAA family ATPase [uncultured Moraxella sp.]|uniref:AAA family ATPase n=1 Tax=uncultured Moraxella sp. TaxID=263769 RepID=UPI0025FA7290|nr:AAA family ATPase [uncultured Moraxella sp.]
MKVDLTDNDLFNFSEIEFNKKVNFIFGKNGCGKSTITKLVKDQCNDYDVRVFQGFESVISENNTLDTVILGEENTEINQEISKKENQIEGIRKDIESIRNNLIDNGTENLWKEYKIKEKEVANIENEIDDFCRNKAREIKNHGLKISSTSYDIGSFKHDIPYAKGLEIQDIEKLESLLRSEVKSAQIINKLNINLSNELKDVNTLLQGKVVEKTRLSRLDDNAQKRDFAEKGLSLHQAGEQCAFCNNIVSKETLAELESYFSADDVRNFKHEIENKIKELESYISDVQNISIDSSKFYADYKSDIDEINHKLGDLKNEYEIFLNKLISELNNKLAYLFEECEKLALTCPDDINSIINHYNQIVDDNNSSNLIKKQTGARDALRYHFVKEYCDKFQYEAKKSNLEVHQNLLQVLKNKVDGEESKIKACQNNINQIEENIKQLLESTKNEKILVERINKKLKLYASFELIHQETSNDYKVRCLRNLNIRSVQELSTGEKNLIAFLYFIEKLNELSNNSHSSKRCVVFDDPMNSNDDAVQYLIIEELQRLKDRHLRDNEIFILLTHNIHFYLNVKYGCKYDKCNFYRLVKIKNRVNCINIDNGEDDFKTNYAALWQELQFLLSQDDASPNMLLNPIRRIIETYTKFNGLNQSDFFANTSGARKLFNVNSHSIDDLEAELNGRSKQEIIVLFKSCFEENNAIAHFQKFFGDNP